MSRTHCLFISLLTVNATALVGNENQDIKSGPCHPVKWSTEAKEDPQRLTTCLNLSASTQREFRSKIEEVDNPPVHKYVRGRISILPTSWFHLMAEGYIHTVEPIGGNAELTTTRVLRKTIVQLGNSGVHRHRLMIGRSIPPFGLNLTDFRLARRADYFDNFFGSILDLSTYTYDNQRDWTVTLGIGRTPKHANDNSSQNLEAFGRASYDFAALEGTRFIFSFSQNEDVKRRFSAATINRNGKGETSSIEIIRTWSRFPYDPKEFEQLFRLTWSGRAFKGAIGGVLLEDVSDASRTGVLFLRPSVLPWTIAEIALGYRSIPIDHVKSHWIGQLGLEVRL